MIENSKTKIPVSVIIVNYNTRELTKKALEALYDSSVLPEEIIVVDNNSSDGSVEMIKNEFLDVILIESKENLGFARANNSAIREKAAQPYVWLLNSDTETGEDSLKELFDFMEKNQKVGAVEPLLVYPNGDLQSVGGYFPSIGNVFLYLFPLSYFLSLNVKSKIKSIALYPQNLPEEGRGLDYVTGAAMFLRKKALDEAGLLGEDYFMYFEETDLCWRLKNKGWKVIAINTEPVRHVYGGSFKGKYDVRRLQIFLDSLKIFVKKNYNGIKKRIILLEIALFGEISMALKGLKK